MITCFNKRRVNYTHLSNWLSNAINSISQASDIDSLDALRIEFLGKKSYINLQMASLRELPVKDRPAAGALMNEIKQKVKEHFNIRKRALENIKLNTQLAKEIIDVSLPGRRIENGGLHPITRTLDRVENFFNALGFSVVIGPEIEDDYHNFDALNIPFNHPVRNDHDTFRFDSNRLLRTQTSSVQIRVMKDKSPPIRIIAPGRVYRNDYDQTHTPMFHQIEGLVVDKHVTFSNLKGILEFFLNNFFEEHLQIRFRPSYFPFTEPSAEVDIISKKGKWLEVLGCGMVHPNVLTNVGIDPEIYSGFAFGMGIERLTMLRYGITDIRDFFENDSRFLRQFK